MEYKLTKTYDLPVDELFMDFSSTDKMAAWMSRSNEDSTIAQIDFTPGGKYHFEVTSSIGDVNHYYGEYTAIKENREIDMVWNDGQVKESLVTFDFTDFDGRTVLTLTHANLPNELSFRNHQEFWVQCLNHLDEYIKEAS